VASFWLVEVLAMQGRFEEAEARFKRLLDLGNDLGLIAEEYQPEVGQLGNFPQAFTHVAIIGAAQHLADARSHGAWPKTTVGERAASRKKGRTGAAERDLRGDS
jgi:GH15 family glucan-1,4-alpha-glucosidase